MAKKATTVRELTSSKYRELIYDTAGDEVKGKFVKKVCRLLNKCGMHVPETNTYDDVIARAVSTFQSMAGMNPTGILDDKTLVAINAYADMEMPDAIVTEDTEESDLRNIESLYPHFDSYFKDKRSRVYRQNHKDIKIVLGNDTITKTIKDVFMRSVTIEVDTSGNPISEIYEFIARDIKESDELTDTGKYEGPRSYPPADIVKYNFDSLFGNKDTGKKKKTSKATAGTAGFGTGVASGSAITGSAITGGAITGGAVSGGATSSGSAASGG